MRGFQAMKSVDGGIARRDSYNDLVGQLVTFPYHNVTHTFHHH